MGATHTETVTDIVKAMIQSGKIPAADKKMSELDAARSILKRAIYLVKYGIKVYKDPELDELVDHALLKEFKEKEAKRRKAENGKNSQPKEERPAQRAKNVQVVRSMKDVSLQQQKVQKL